MSINIVSSSDEEFNSYTEDYNNRIKQIRLPADINTQMGTYILSQLDEAYANLRMDYSKLEAAKDRVDSIIRQKERSEATGSNEQARKKHATEYLENYENARGEAFDMYEYQRMINRRFFIVKGMIDTINNKQQRLITMTGLIKIDSSLGLGAVQD